MTEKELLRKAREYYLYDVDINNYPKATIDQLIEFWEEVNDVLK